MNPPADRSYFVLGMGKSGAAVTHLLAKKGCGVVAYDDDETALSSFAQSRCDDELKARIEIASPHSAAESLLRCDALVLSPGVPLSHELVKRAEGKSIEVTGELEMAFRYSSCRIVGVTGTNGKSTVVSILGDILEKAGQRCVVAGNIGMPFSSVVSGDEQHDIAVLEISSFQLDTIHDFKADVAVLLNVTVDHLDRYSGSFEKYAASKARILNRADRSTCFIYNDEDPVCKRIADSFTGMRMPFSSSEALKTGVFVKDEEIVRSVEGETERILKTQEFTPAGVHNLENALAAVATVSVLEVGKRAIGDALRQYRPLPHRMELVRVVGGVAYINDSKATNVDATIKSLRSIEGHTVLIIGGQDKDGDFAPLARWVSSVREVIVLGEAKNKIKAALNGFCTIRVADGLEEAVQLAGRIASPGDTVLLAPACASFDMFSSYVERGEVFRAAVNHL
jgi:UDP-N-acetylmuramoylalanine--D-glutamate ligase